MLRSDILDKLQSFMDLCDNPDIWEELLYVRHNEAEFSDSELTKRFIELSLEYISELKKGD